MITDAQGSAFKPGPKPTNKTLVYLLGLLQKNLEARSMLFLRVFSGDSVFVFVSPIGSSQKVVANLGSFFSSQFFMMV